ncbi:TPA: hypothetical protein R4Z40_002586 [Klebsiella variicola subsp. variicola]|nr:hypothetical protein [Klebsiella variicola subsp. variicola]
MEQSLTVLGMLFFMFLVLAAAVEAILEIFRGLLESIGITFLKGKYSVEDAIKLSRDISDSSNALLNSKIEVLKATAQQLDNKMANVVGVLDQLNEDLLSGVKNRRKLLHC